MEKSLDESRGNEERGRAQGTDVGERARVPWKKFAAAGSVGPRRARGEHAPPCVLAEASRCPGHTPPPLPWARAEVGGRLVRGGEWAGAAGLTTS